MCIRDRPKATEAEERDKYQGEAIISLLNELKNVLANSVCTKISLFTTAEGIKLLMDLARLYESVFSDGRCGVAPVSYTHLITLSSIEISTDSLKSALLRACSHLSSTLRKVSTVSEEISSGALRLQRYAL